MRNFIRAADVIATIRTFLGYNKEDKEKLELILNMGATLLGVSVKRLLEIIKAGG